MKLLMSVLVIMFCCGVMAAQSGAANTPKVWKNPENKQRYTNALRQASEAKLNEGKAWANYANECNKAQEDVRRVRNEAIKGAVKGGPAGAAYGAAKGAAQGTYNRGKEYYQNRKK